MPVPAPAGLGDSFNVTALGGSPTAQPCCLPHPTESSELSLGKQRTPEPYSQGSFTLGLSAVARLQRSEKPVFQVSGL